VIELSVGITAYPPQEAGGRWRAVWTEDGRRRYCEAVTEEKLAAKLAKVTERLEADAPGMERSGSDLIAWYLSPDRFPGDEQWSRKHAHTPAAAVRAIRGRGHRRHGLPGHPGCRHAADR
jgi:hypothetical protein